MPHLFSCFITLINGGISMFSRLYFSDAMPYALNCLAKAFVSVITMITNSFFSLDAVVRSGFRLLFSKKHLLEWTTAADSNSGSALTFITKSLPSVIVGIFLIFYGNPVAAIAGIILAPAYVKSRLFADIWSNPTGDGYQQTKALISIAEGGWFGKGPGYGFLHEVFAYESDIVFATISEEWGLLFAIMTVLVLMLIVAMPLVNPPRSYYHGTMCAGVCAAFTMQMALNIFGSCNMIPFTGVTLPFISAGGSSMVTSGLMIGMIVAAQSPVFTNPKKSKKKGKQKRRTV
jgi:cell division protein FtsW (lipid II flippase)